MKLRRQMPALIAAFLLACCTLAHAAELRLCLHAEPKTFDPLLVEDESSDAVRYLTAGVLVRLNRLTQELEPELATKWTISEGGRRIDFALRRSVSFSNGVPFTAEDVAFTIKRAMDPALHSPVGDQFRSAPGAVETSIAAPGEIAIRFPAPVAALALQFDQLPILSARAAKNDKAVLGPFTMADYQPGNYVLLRRNPRYWKKDAGGRQLPYVDSVRLDIQQNRDLELLRFRRGQIDFIAKLDPEIYERLAADMPKAVHDAGPSFDSLQLWFNQTSRAPVPAWKKQWFASTAFRRAISFAINRADICRIVYHGHAQPAAGPVAPSNRFWANAALHPDPYAPERALELLAKDGFRKNGSTLYDRGGHPVEFSLATNAGNKLHERTMSLIQQDLGKIGIHLNVVTLDFPSLIERITSSFDYEACMLPLSASLDPSDQMNVWLSSAPNHQWNPSQKSPATPWEAEIDRLTRVQASSLDTAKRKAAFDRVQQIAHDEAPFVYLVHPSALCAISGRVRNAAPALLRPQVFWNMDRLAVAE